MKAYSPFAAEQQREIDRIEAALTVIDDLAWYDVAIPDAADLSLYDVEWAARIADVLEPAARRLRDLVEAEKRRRSESAQARRDVA